MSGGRFRRALVESFDWREIGRATVGPRLKPPGPNSHTHSPRTITPDMARGLPKMSYRERAIAAGLDCTRSKILQETKMAETLLTPSSIKLYGRIVNSVQYIDDTATNATLLGSNNFLQHQLAVNESIETFTGATAVSGRTITVSAAALANLAPGMLVTGLTSAVAGTVGGSPAVTTPSVQVFAPGTYISSISTANTTFNVSTNLPANALNQIGCSMTALSLAVSVARIYAFSFEGAIYSLPRPSLFLVHTAGSPIDIQSRWAKHDGNVRCCGEGVGIC